jgi:hypothetical protein
VLPIESRGQDEDLQLVMSRAGADARPGDLLDGLFAHVHQRDVVLIEDIEVPLLERRPLGAEGMRRVCGCQLVGDDGVLDAGPRLLPPERIGQQVGLAVPEDVAEGEPEMEAPLLPR